MSEKFKSFIQNDAIFYGFMVILVGISSFGLGRASVEVSRIDREGLSFISQIENPDLESNTSTKVVQEVSGFTAGDNFIASKSGTKYHLPSCPGAKQIKLENQITFLTKEEAESAGYKPAANCPGLQ